MTNMTADAEPLPIHLVPAEELHALSRRRRAAVFSCNRAGHIFVTTGKGWTPLVGRQYNEDLVLRACTKALLRKRPQGGRFSINPSSLQAIASHNKQPFLQLGSQDDERTGDAYHRA